MIFKLRYIPATATEYTEIEVHPYDQRNNSITYEFDETIAEARPKLSKPLVFVNELKESRSEASFFVDTLREIETEIYIDIYNDSNELLMTGYFYGRDIEIFSNGVEYLKVSVKLTTFDKYTPYILRSEDEVLIQSISKTTIQYSIFSQFEIKLVGLFGQSSSDPLNPDDIVNFYAVLDSSGNHLRYSYDIAIGIKSWVGLFSREVVYIPTGSNKDMTGWTEIDETESYKKYFRHYNISIPDLYNYINVSAGIVNEIYRYQIISSGNVKNLLLVPGYEDFEIYNTEVDSGVWTLQVSNDVYDLAMRDIYTNKLAMSLRTVLSKVFESVGIIGTIKSSYLFNDTPTINVISRKRPSEALYLIDTWNAVRPFATQMRENGKFVAKDLIDDLYAKFGVKWYIEGDDICLEHEESFDNLEFLDNTGNVYISDRHSYKTEGKELAQEEVYEEITGYSPDSVEQKLIYSNKNSLLSSKKNTKVIKTNVLCSDIDGLIRNGDDSEGLLILEGLPISPQIVTIDFINLWKGQNIRLKPAFTFVNDREYNRAQSSGVLEYDGKTYNFTSIPIKLRENLTIFDGVKPYRVIGHVKDDFGTGFIKKFEAGFNGLVTLELIYR